MARRKQTKGKCLFCERELTKGGMSKHLASCSALADAIRSADADSGIEQNLYRLAIQDAYIPDFWLYLEMNGRKQVEELDRYLRSIWLECCGHMSELSIGKWGTNTVPMEQVADKVFSVGLQFTHIYDFGTSSETLIKVVNMRKGKPLTRHPITLLARNDKPEVFCMECGKPADWLCFECIYEENESGLLCDKHAQEHPHESYGEPVEIYNSPRMGMCGYSGPAEPPY